MAAQGEEPLFVESLPEVLLPQVDTLKYQCTFCGRRFQRAQALGGHMSVHREGKATLAVLYYRAKYVHRGLPSTSAFRACRRWTQPFAIFWRLPKPYLVWHGARQ